MFIVEQAHLVSQKYSKLAHETIPALPKAEFGQLQMEWHNWLATPREGGELSRGCWIVVYSRALLTLAPEP